MSDTEGAGLGWRLMLVRTVPDKYTVATLLLTWHKLCHSLLSMQSLSLQQRNDIQTCIMPWPPYAASPAFPSSAGHLYDSD